MSLNKKKFDGSFQLKKSKDRKELNAVHDPGLDSEPEKNAVKYHWYI